MGNSPPAGTYILMCRANSGWCYRATAPASLHVQALPRAIVRRRDDIRSRLDVAIAEVEAGAASREGVDALLK
jgi:hypothetical protein